MKNELKIENMNKIDVVNAPADTVKIEEKVEDTSKDIVKSATATGEKANTNTKHVITYIGGSEYIDSTGHKWHKGDEKTYSDDEYIKRVDIHFMVNYGEMKHIVVTM
jgi:hypothetical protein